jgi:hypothetical protein
MGNSAPGDVAFEVEDAMGGDGSADESTERAS